MHELSIVSNIAETLHDFFQDHPVQKVYSVTLCVGDVSGVVPSYLTDAWGWFMKEDEILKDSVLKIESIPAVTTCLDCKKEYETVKYGKICPYCKSERTYLLRGNEVMIKEIVVE